MEMQNKTKELDLFSLIQFFINNLKKIFILALLFSCIPAFYLFQNFNSDRSLLVYNLNYNQLEKFKLFKVNDSINELYNNSFIDSLQRKIKITFSEFVREDNEGLLSSLEQKKANDYPFLSDFYIYNKINNFSSNNNLDININFKFNDSKNQSFEFLSISTPIENNNVDKAKSKLDNFILDTNTFINSEIYTIIEEGLLFHQASKGNVLKKFEIANNLFYESYNFTILNKINELSEERDIAVDLNIANPLVLEKDILMNYTPSDIPIKIPYSDYTHGFKVLNKKIEILKNKLNNKENIPKIFTNELIYNLIQTDFTTNDVLNNLNIKAIKNNENAIIKFDRSNIVNNSISLFQLLTYIFLIYIISILIIFILLLLVDLYRNREN